MYGSMKGRACGFCDMAGNTNCLRYSGRGPPPLPSRAGGISSGIVSLDSLGQNLNSHPFSHPGLLNISSGSLFLAPLIDTEQLMLLRAEGQPFAGTPSGVPACRLRAGIVRCVLRRRKDGNAQPPSTPAGMGVAGSVRMKHAHTISALPNIPHTEKGVIRDCAKRERNADTVGQPSYVPKRGPVDGPAGSSVTSAAEAEAEAVFHLPLANGGAIDPERYFLAGLSTSLRFPVLFIIFYCLFTWLLFHIDCSRHSTMCIWDAVIVVRAGQHGITPPLTREGRRDRQTGRRADGQTRAMNRQGHAYISQPRLQLTGLRLAKSQGPTHIARCPMKTTIWHHLPALGPFPSAGRRYLSFRGKGAAVVRRCSRLPYRSKGGWMFNYCMGSWSHDAGDHFSKHKNSVSRLPTSAVPGKDTMSVALRLSQATVPSSRV